MNDRNHTSFWASRIIQACSRVGGRLILAVASALWMTAAVKVHGQAPGVPVGKNGCVDIGEVSRKAEVLKEAGVLLGQQAAEDQLKRRSCVLPALAKPSRKQLSGRQVWQKARASFVRVGWYFLCPNCDKRHIQFGGGFYVTEDGVVATAHHVIALSPGMREGYLVAATEEGEVLPVLEILASNAADDTALIRIKPPGRVQALPINPNVHPGDAAWCYSNPLERSSYFSDGIITRFTDINTDRNGTPMIRMGVSTDWAPGSSGSAVLDAHGNAIGLVSSIEVLMSPGGNKEQYMAIHHAACAAKVLKLIAPAR